MDDHVIVPHNASLNPVNITVEAWIKAKNTGEYQIIIDKGHGSGHGWGWVAQIRPDDRIDFCHGNGDIDYSGACALTTSSLTDDAWHHVVGKLDGATIKIYIDGEWKTRRLIPVHLRRIIRTFIWGLPGGESQDSLTAS